jgi:FMN phosphatase YigB (HAD superfamily)
MTIRAALIDFSGTLFRLDYTPQVLEELLGDHAAALGTDDKAELLRKLTAPTSRTTGLSAQLQDDWERRDLAPDAHLRANVAVLVNSGLNTEAANAFYGGMLRPDCWLPYPDTVEALRTLHEGDIKIAVVSNIAWDIRPVFRVAGVEDLVDEYVLSFELGAIKPDPKIFRTACERLDVEPSEALMIGDSAEADGGATAIGAAFRQVEALPVLERPRALRRIVETEFADVVPGR